MNIITSLQNQRVKLAYSLQQRSGSRRKERKILLEGMRLVRDAFERGHQPEYALYSPSTADHQLIGQLLERDVKCYPVSEDVLKHISDTQQPQGIVAVFPMPRPALPKQAERILILDAIREPGNMGTILRTAAAADVQIVILASGCVDPYNPKVLRAGMGSHFRLPIVEATWEEIMGYCTDVPVYLAAGDGDVSYTDVNWKVAWALVIGNEAHGIGQQASRITKQRIHIPMAANTESINAAVATGVILFEARRQTHSI